LVGVARVQQVTVRANVIKGVKKKKVVVLWVALLVTGDILGISKLKGCAMIDNKDTTNAARQARSRERRREAGYIRKEIWIKLDWWKQIQELINKKKGEL